MRKFFVLLTMLSLVTATNAMAESADSKKKEDTVKSDEMSKEMRAKMAASHEKMALCLRSEKPMKECRDEMHEQCMGEGAEGCGMMTNHKGMMKKHKGHK